MMYCINELCPSKLIVKIFKIYLNYIFYFNSISELFLI